MAATQEERIDALFTDNPEKQVSRITKLLRENVIELEKNVKVAEAFERALKESGTNTQSIDSLKKIADSTAKLKKTQDDLVKTDILNTRLKNEIIKQNDLLEKQEKRRATEAAKIVDGANKLTKIEKLQNDVRNAGNNTLEKANALMKLYTAQKSKLNLATDEGARKNEIYNKAIERTNNYILANADSETKRIKGIGLYAKGWSNIGNSISQITREVPNFAQSAEIGIRSLTNNIGPLQDAIKGIIVQNKLLRAEGKQTESVLKQISGAIFSESTLLSVGITLFAIYGEQIIDFAKSLFKGRDAMDAFAEKQQAMNEAFKSTEFTNTIKDLASLRINLDLAKQSSIDKNDVLKQYNETLGKTTGQLTNFDDIEAKIVKYGPIVIKMTALKMAANIELQKSVEMLAKLEEDRANPNTFADRFNAMIVSLPINNTSQFTQGLGKADEIKRNELLETEERYRSNRLKKIEKDANDRLKLSASLQKQAADLAKKNDLDHSQNGDKDKEASEKAQKDFDDKVKKQKEALEKAQKQRHDDAKQAIEDDYNLAKSKIENASKTQTALDETEKTKIQADADKNKAIIEDEKTSLNEKLTANGNYFSDMGALIELDSKKEKDAINESIRLARIKIAELARLANLQGTTKADKATYNTGIKAEQNAIAENNKVLATLEDKKNASLLQSANETAIAKEVIINKNADEETKEQIRHLAELKNTYDTYTTEALTDLDQQYSKGLISTTDYHKQREYIAQMANQNSLRAQLSYAEELLKNTKLTDAERVSLETKISGLKKDLAKTDAEIAEDIENKRLQKFKTFSEKYKAIAAGVMDVISATTSILSDREKAQAEEKQKQLDKDTKAELDSLDKKSLSAKNKENERKRIETEAELRKERIHHDSVTRLRKFAAFQKAADATNIISGTALAVVAALGSRPFTPLNIALAIGVGLTGAASLARALAAPLPQYAKGITSTPSDSYAIVGEAGVEKVKEPSGKAYLTPNKATRVWLPRGSQVTSNADLLKEAHQVAMFRLGNSNQDVTANVYGEKLIEAFEDGMDKVVKAVEKNKSNVMIQSDLNYLTYKYKHN
jgi:hypothetical protein